MSGHKFMSNVVKKLIVVFLAALLVLTFAACGKDKTESVPSSTTNSGPAQDYDVDEWGENAADDEQDEATESLWNDLLSGNGGAEIGGSNTDEEPSSEDTSSNEETSSTPSSDTENSEPANDNADESELNAEIVVGEIGKIS